MTNAGAGKSEIVLTDEIFPVDHFIGRHDRLFGRAIIIESNQVFVLISLDVTSLQNYAVEAIKKRISEIYLVPSEHIFISVTHTFSAPHTRSLGALEQADQKVRDKNQVYLKLILEAVTNAMQEAKQTMQPVSLSCHLAYADCNINRDIEGKEGYWLGQNPEGYSNKTIPLIKLLTDSGKLLAVIYSVDVQSSIIEKAETFTVSSDLIGLTSQKIETACDCIALFLLGSAADQTPRISEASFKVLEELSSQLAAEIVSHLEKDGIVVEGDSRIERLTVKVKGQEIPDMRMLKPTRNYQFIPSIDREVEVSILTLGELALVMMKPEITSITGQQIKEQSPYLITLAATMINGGQKYMADEQSYQNFTYEALNSMFACGSAELVSQAVINKLKERK